MRNQIFERLKRSLGILLAVFFVVSLTYASASASSSDSSFQMTETKSVSLDKCNETNMTETKSVSLDNETNNEPNNFILSGVGQHKDVRINYSTTSFRNVPIFSYNDSKDTYYFMGSEIRAQETEIGTMVTVTEMYYPHQCEIMLTLLVPDINLDGDCSEQEFETIAIRTTSKSTYIGQQGVKGAVQSYEVIHLNGTANIVYP